MARKVATNLDLIGNQLLNALFQNLAAAPGSPKTGQFYWDTVKKELGVYNGTEWRYTTVTNTGGITEAEVLTLIAAKLNGLSWKNPVRLVTVAALPANTQSGAEATAKLTANANGVLTIDGEEVQLNDRVLVKNEGTGSHNGIYVCTVKGEAGAKWVLTRTEDAAKGTQMLDATTRVEQGATKKGSTFTCNTAPPITVDTTSLEFVEIESALEIKADGTYLQRTANTIEPKFNETSPAEPAAEGETGAVVLSNQRTAKCAFRTKAGTNAYTITHNLNSELLVVQGYETSAKKPSVPVEFDYEISGPNKIVINFPTAPANTMYDLIIIG
jgi:hypothetical protein